MSSRFESGCSLPKLSFIQFNTLRARFSLLDFAFGFAPLMCSSAYAPAPIGTVAWRSSDSGLAGERTPLIARSSLLYGLLYLTGWDI